MYIVTAEEMYEMDRYTIQEMGLDERILMENAGRAVTDKITEIISKQDQLGILIGSGNNGGDGFVIARTLHNEGYDVHAVQIVPNEKIVGNAHYHKQLWLNIGGRVTVTMDPLEIKEHLKKWDVVVDAMIGIGVQDALREPVATIVSDVNEISDCVISVDIPTGLPADEGVDNFSAIQADYTLVIEALKMSLFVQHTAPFYGEWAIVSIGIPIYQLAPMLQRQVWERRFVLETLPKRKWYSHKGSHGKALAVGGSKVMPGSIAMTAKAALKAGAGLVTIGTRESVIPSIASTCAEATFHTFSEDEKHISLPAEKFHAIAVGMGIGRSLFAEQLVIANLQANIPLIVDADGLYYLKRNLSLVKDRKQPTIVTPHPGEMAMLMEVSIAEVLRRPFHYAKQLATDFELFVVLKGVYTIITDPFGRQAVNQTGNQGLAKGGSGDVLSGVLLAMIMQHEDTFQALCNACFLHGSAADVQVENGHSYYDLLATDVIAGLPTVFRTFLT